MSIASIVKLLVIGDYIEDHYTFGSATRLCPEGPVPIIKPESTDIRGGGVGLVCDQLQELTGERVNAWYGSLSRKRRIFADNHLICRLDEDSIPTFHADKLPIDHAIAADALVICDYNKGAMTPQLAHQLLALDKPTFVDAKHHWHWYAGSNVTIFPNSREAEPVPTMPDPTKIVHEAQFGCIIHKLGANGCKMECDTGFSFSLPATQQNVVDVTGAGDVFMAAFVYAWSIQLPRVDCLGFANMIAGESCRYLGTHVVSKGYADEAIARIKGKEQDQSKEVAATKS